MKGYAFRFLYWLCMIGWFALLVAGISPVELFHVLVIAFIFLVGAEILDAIERSK